MAEKVKEFFHNEGIHSTTIQPEFTEVQKTLKNNICCGSLNTGIASLQLPGDESASETENCALDCPSKDRTCAASTCCGPSKQVKDVAVNTSTAPDVLPIAIIGDGLILEHVSTNI